MCISFQSRFPNSPALLSPLYPRNSRISPLVAVFFYTIMSKPEATGIEVASSIDDSTAVIDFSDEDNQVGFAKPETSRLLSKLDRTLLPFLALLYLLSFLDRSNIGNAKLAGLEKDLKMEGYDYSVGLSPTKQRSTLSFALFRLIVNSLLFSHRLPSPSSSPFTSLPRSRPTWP